MTLPRSSQRWLDEIARVAEHALETLARLGVDHADVNVGHGNELEVSVRRGEVELIKEAKTRGMSVRVIRNDRVATSSTNDLSRPAIERFAESVVQMAEISEEDPLAAPPAPEELSRTWPDLDLFDPRTDRIRADRAVEQALKAERAAFRADKRITSSEGASFSRSSGHSVLATTGGFVGRKAGTYQSIVVQAIADDEGGKKRNGVYWTGARHVEDLESPTVVGREAARRAIASLGARKIETGDYPVVFDKEAGRSIVSYVAGCVLGDTLYRQRSYLAARLGTCIGSKHVTLIDDPLLPRGPGSIQFDGEGRKVRRNVVARAGTLQSYLLDSYSARKLKMKPTGSAGGGGGIPHSTTSNFYLARGRSEPASLLKGVRRGLYVTRMMGFGFDPTTGDLSKGAEGFLIEDGELSDPVGEVTVALNLDDLLKAIDRVATDLEHRTSVSSPSFRVAAMKVGGA